MDPEEKEMVKSLDIDIHADTIIGASYVRLIDEETSSLSFLSSVRRIFRIRTGAAKHTPSGPLRNGTEYFNDIPYVLIPLSSIIVH